MFFILLSFPCSSVKFNAVSNIFLFFQLWVLYRLFEPTQLTQLWVFVTSFSIIFCAFFTISHACYICFYVLQNVISFFNVLLFSIVKMFLHMVFFYFVWLNIFHECLYKFGKVVQ